MRLFFYILAGFVLGFLIGYYTTDIKQLIFFIFIIGVVIAICSKNKLLPSTCCLVIGIFVLTGSIFSITGEYSYDKDYSSFNNKEVILEGTIVSEPDERENGVYYLFRPYREKKFIRLFNKDKKVIYNYGDVVVADFLLLKPKGQRNPGGFDYKQYLKTINVSATGTLNSIKKTGFKPESTLRYYSIKIKNYISGLIYKYIPRDKSGIVEGMLIGSKSNLSEDTTEAFRGSGISHLLSVSGGHAVFFLMPVSFILKILKVSKKASCITEIICLTAFAYITGLGVSICRAVIMMSITRGAFLLKRSTDSFNSLCIAAMLILLSNPYTLFSAGFQLSFAAVLAIMILPVHIKKYIGRISFIKMLPASVQQVVSISVAAQLGVLPLTAFLFNKVSVIGLVSNLAVTPFISVLYIVGFVALVFNAFGISFIGSALTYSLYMISYIIEQIALFFSNFKISEVSHAFDLFNVSAYYMLLGIFLFYKKKRFLILLILIPIIFFPFNSFYSGMNITFIDVGQGDSILVRLPDRVNLLVDTGVTGKETEEVLRHYRISKIDVLFLTHAHNDHIGGAVNTINKFSVKKIVVPDLKDSKGFEEIYSLAQKKGIPVIEAGSGDSFTFKDNISIMVLGPIYDKSQDYSLNNGSLVLKLRYGRVDFLLTGDIEETAEKDLLERYGDVIFDSNVLKVPHHGSSTSLSDAFLKAVSPEISVISVGERNKFNHPSKDTVEKLLNHNRLYRTDERGAVILKTNGKDKIVIKTFLKG